jgi:hypothetical protein
MDGIALGLLAGTYRVPKHLHDYSETGEEVNAPPSAVTTWCSVDVGTGEKTGKDSCR